MEICPSLDRLLRKCCGDMGKTVKISTCSYLCRNNRSENLVWISSLLCVHVSVLIPMIYHLSHKTKRACTSREDRKGKHWCIMSCHGGAHGYWLLQLPPGLHVANAAAAWPARCEEYPSTQSSCRWTFSALTAGTCPWLLSLPQRHACYTLFAGHQRVLDQSCRRPATPHQVQPAAGE